MRISVLFLFLGLYALPTTCASAGNPQDGEAKIVDEQECSMSESMDPSFEEEGEVAVLKSHPLDSLLKGITRERFTSRLIGSLSELDLAHHSAASSLSAIPPSILCDVYRSREFLMLDFTEVFNLENSARMFGVQKRLALDNPDVRESPSAMVSLLLQLEWRLTILALSIDYSKHSRVDSAFFRTAVKIKGVILESISESMPLVVRVFKNPLSYSASKELKKAYDVDPNFKNSLKHVGQPGVFLDPVDLHDAIDFFAKSSSDSTVRHAELSHKLASFIMATNMPEYYEQSSTSDASAVNYQVALEDFIVSCKDGNNPNSFYHVVLALLRKGHFEGLKFVHFCTSDLPRMFLLFLTIVNFEANITLYANIFIALPLLEDQMKLVTEITDSYKFSEHEVKHLLKANLNFLGGPGYANIKMIQVKKRFANTKCTAVSIGENIIIHVTDLAQVFTRCFVNKHMMFKNLLLNPEILIVKGKADKEFEIFRNELISSIKSTPLGIFLLKVLPFMHAFNNILFNSLHISVKNQQYTSIQKYENVDGVALQAATEEFSKLTKDSKHLHLEPHTVYLISFFMAMGNSNRKEFTMLRWIAHSNYFSMSEEDAYDVMLNVFGMETINSISSAKSTIFSEKTKPQMINRQCQLLLQSIIIQYRAYSRKISNRRNYMQNYTQDLKDIDLSLNAYVEKELEQEKEVKNLVSTFVGAWRRPDAQFRFGNVLSLQGVKCEDQVKKVLMVLMQDVLIELLLIYGIPTDKFFSSVQCVAHNFSIFSTKPEKYPSFIPCQEFEIPTNFELPHMIKNMQSFLRGDWISSSEEPLQRLLIEAVKFKAVTQNLSEYLYLFTPYDYANSLFCIPSSDRRLLGSVFKMRRCPVTVEEDGGDARYLGAMRIASKLLNNVKFPDAPVDLNPAVVVTVLFGMDRDFTKLVTRTLSRYIPELEVAINSSLGRLSLLKTFCVKANIHLPATEEEAAKMLRRFFFAEILAGKAKEDKDESSRSNLKAEVNPPTSAEGNAKTNQSSVMGLLPSNGDIEKKVKKTVNSLPSKSQKREEKKTGKEDEEVELDTSAMMSNEKKNKSVVKNKPNHPTEQPFEQAKQDIKSTVPLPNSIKKNTPPILIRAEIKPLTSTENLSVKKSTRKLLLSNDGKANEKKEPINSLPSKRKIKAEEKKTGREDVAEVEKKNEIADGLKVANDEPILSSEVLLEQTKQDDMKDVTLNNSNTKAGTKPKANNKKEKKVKESPILLNNTTVSIEAEKEIVVVEEEKRRVSISRLITAQSGLL